MKYGNLFLTQYDNMEEKYLHNVSCYLSLKKFILYFIKMCKLKI